MIIGAGRFPELVFVPVKEIDENGEVIDGGAALTWEGLELPKNRMPCPRSACCPNRM